MELSLILFGIALAVYCAAAVLYSFGMSRRRAATVLAVAGLVVQSAGIAMRGIEQHRTPFTNLFESLIFFAWALMAVYLAMSRGKRIAALGTFTAVVASVTILCGLLLPKDVSASLVPALRSQWGSIHVMSCLVSYAGFVLAFGASLGYMVQERMLKAKKISVLQKNLSSLDDMDHLAYRMVAFAFPMLTLGIITGALWAQAAWGSYWNWDPKETWALITWLVYAAYLHVRIVQGWRGKWANRLLVTGFACILITYLGVNFLTSGLHKYNW